MQAVRTVPHNMVSSESTVALLFLNKIKADFTIYGGSFCYHKKSFRDM